MPVFSIESEYNVEKEKVINLIHGYSKDYCPHLKWAGVFLKLFRKVEGTRIVDIFVFDSV